MGQVRSHPAKGQEEAESGGRVGEVECCQGTIREGKTGAEARSKQAQGGWRIIAAWAKRPHSREAGPAPEYSLFVPSMTLHTFIISSMTLHTFLLYLLHDLAQQGCPCFTNQDKESSRLKGLPEVTRLARGKDSSTFHVAKEGQGGRQRTLNGGFWNVGIIKKKKKKLLIFFLILKATYAPCENFRHCSYV